MSSAKLEGYSRSFLGSSAGSWWRKDVRRCELWTMIGNSIKTSLYVSFDFCILKDVSAKYVTSKIQYILHFSGELVFLESSHESRRQSERSQT